MNIVSAKFDDLILLARRMTDERLTRFPNYGPYIHARDQIAFIENLLADGRNPNQKEKDFIDIALMALKELDADEPDYSLALCDVSFWFKKL